MQGWQSEIPLSKESNQMTFYIVAAICHTPPKYLVRNKLVNNRSHAALYDGPAEAKKAVKRMFLMHPHVRTAEVSPYNPDNHPDVPAVVLTREEV